MADGDFRSIRLKDFKRMFDKLPARFQLTAIARYKNYFRIDPYHPLLERHTLHDVSDAEPASIAVTMARGYRAVSFFDEPKRTYVWYWCGSHADYDRRFRPGR